MIFGYPQDYFDYKDVMAIEYLLGSVGRPVRTEADLDGVHLLVLFGGEDISTCWYGQKPVFADASEAPSRRDAMEVELAEACMKRSVPILGICRGAQLMCCLLGGSLWQHVDNHECGEHKVVTDDGVFNTNSYHHQVMRPTPEMELFGWAECRSPTKCSETKEDNDEDEPEILYHRSKKVLMIQGHPEWVSEDHDLFKLTHRLVKELLCA